MKSSRRQRGSANRSRKTSGRPRAVSDELLLDAERHMHGTSGLLILLHGSGLAAELTQQLPDRNWIIWSPECFFAESAARHLTQVETTQEEAPSKDDRESDDSPYRRTTPQPTDEALPEVDGDPMRRSAVTSAARIECSPVPPEGPFDYVIIQSAARSDSEQMHELLQAAHDRLKAGGRLITTTENKRDHWLGTQLRKLYSRVTADRKERGLIYAAHRTEALKKSRDYAAQTALRHDEKLIQIVTRPGVFCHRRVDAGARSLLKSLDQFPWTAAPPERILDLGCGSGVITNAVASRWPHAEVLGMDSHSAAVRCTMESAVVNGLENVQVRLCSDGSAPQPGTWDLVLANPPYYSNYRISELFLQAALKALSPRGQLRLVTKLVNWHTERMAELFGDIECLDIGAYNVVAAAPRKLARPVDDA